MKRVVLDTNVWISALLSKEGVCAKIVDRVIEGRIQSFTSKEILEEIEDVCSRHVDSKTTLAYIDLIRSVSEVVHPRTFVHICEDPDDDKFIDCAMTVDAAIVSGDKHLQGFGMTPRQFLDQL